MTITITIQNRDLPPGRVTGAYAKYLEMQRDLGYDRVRWDENEE